MKINLRANVNGIELDVMGFPAVIDGLVLEKEEHEDGFTLSLLANRDADVSMEVSFQDSTSRFFVPSVWYDGNPDGEGLFPTSKRSPYWTFEETRMPLPGIIGTETEEGWRFIYLDECSDGKALFSSGWDAAGIKFLMPPHETPWSYRGKTKLIKTAKPGPVMLKKGEKIERRFFIKEERGKLYDAYRDLIKSISEEEKLRQGWDEYKALKLARLLNMVIPMEDDTASLIMGEGNGAVDDVYKFTAGSFLVKSIEAATAFMRTSDTVLSRVQTTLNSTLKRIGASSIEEIAKKIGEFFLKCETNKGFYQDSVDLISGERGGYLGISEHPEFRYLMNARCTGESMKAFIDLYDETGYKPFLELPKRIASFYIKHQLDTGSFGRWWDKDGNAIDSKGTNGAYIAVMLLRLIPYLDNKEEAVSALKKAIKYYTELALSDEFHGDTLDADSTDKEAGVAILSLLLTAAEKGYRDERVMQGANEAASFILTWIWQKQSYLPPSSPLGKMGFSTKGMSSVSAAHHHLDFYGMLIAYLYLRLWRLTGEVFWKAQAVMLMNTCLSLIGTEENGYLGRDRSAEGWQPEQINHTSWDYFSDESKMNGYAGIDIAWVNVLGYSSLLSIEEEFPEIFLR